MSPSIKTELLCAVAGGLLAFGIYAQLFLLVWAFGFWVGYPLGVVGMAPWIHPGAKWAASLIDRVG